MRCRICGSTRNLKYTPLEIHRMQGNKSKNKPRLPLPSPLKQIANISTGNICIICDERLQNFHHEEMDIDIDIERSRQIFVDDDEQLLRMFLGCKQQSNQPIESHGGSDGDPEIIEVLTSRETTPELMTTTDNNQSVDDPKINKLHTIESNNIIEIIDLEDEDEGNAITNANHTEFTSPENQQEKTRLLGYLSLLTSSDSETESNTKPHVQPSVPKSAVTVGLESISPQSHNNNSVTMQHNFPTCNICGRCFLEKKILENHMEEHKRDKCPVCLVQFPADLDLVYHMRQKHRLYDGNELFEGSRCSQDSAMTIRLRFLQTFNFYECQLCGVIDSQFKAHKDHIMQKHADESKSLRDPMMQSKQKCPICKQNIRLLVDVFRHLLMKHTQTEYLEHIKKVSEFAIPGIKNKVIEITKHCADVWTDRDEKQYVFRCQMCSSVFKNVQTFYKHLNGHNIDEWKQHNKKQLGVSPQTTDLQGRPKRNSEKFANIIRQESGVFDEDNDLYLMHVNNQLDTNFMPVAPAAKKAKKLNLPKENKEQKTFKRPQILSVSTTKSKISANHLENNNKRPKKLKRKTTNRNNDTAKAGSHTKVKVKAPIRNFPTQKYNCKYCQSTFKGFRKLHLHLISSHQSEEFYCCKFCPCTFTSENALKDHCQNLHPHNSHVVAKRKRKQSTISQSILSDTYILKYKHVDENFNTEERDMQNEMSLEKSQEALQEPIWLQELIKRSFEKSDAVGEEMEIEKEIEAKVDLSYSEKEELEKLASSLCCFCAKLFDKPEECSSHEKLHTESNEMPWIYFTSK